MLAALPTEDQGDQGDRLELDALRLEMGLRGPTYVAAKHGTAVGGS